MSKTVLIILSTVLVLGLTLLVTNILSRRKKTDLADWEVGGRDLPYYVVIGTQFATAMGGGVLVGHVGNAYNFGLSILFYGQYLSGQRPGSRCQRRPNRPQAAGAATAKARRPRSQAGQS